MVAVGEQQEAVNVEHKNNRCGFVQMLEVVRDPGRVRVRTAAFDRILRQIGNRKVDNGHDASLTQDLVQNQHDYFALQTGPGAGEPP